MLLTYSKFLLPWNIINEQSYENNIIEPSNNDVTYYTFNRNSLRYYYNINSGKTNFIYIFCASNIYRNIDF